MAGGLWLGEGASRNVEGRSRQIRGSFNSTSRNETCYVSTYASDLAHHTPNTQ